MKKKTATMVRDEFLDCVKQTIERVSSSDGDYRPFHRNLLSNEIVTLSKFERSFSTSFGQRVLETISKYIAADVAGTSEIQTQKETNLSISESCLASIENHISLLRQNKLERLPKWKEDLKTISKNDRNGSHRVISDLYFVRNGLSYYFSIKTVKPNIDQTAEAKRDMLKLYANDPRSNVYLALPYNPYGEIKSDYDHSPSFKIFDMINDPCVLIGEEYWDLVGGKGTYQELLAISKEVGVETKKLIFKNSSNK